MATGAQESVVVVSARTALVLFGTETGTSQDLALEVSRTLERLHFVTDVEEFDAVHPQELTRYTLVAFVVATTGQGEFPSNARKFWKSLLLKRLRADFLAGLRYALVGLCDSSYPKYNLAARKLHKRLGQLGASSLLPPCEADEQGEDSTDGAFLVWSHQFKSQLVALYPLGAGQEPVPDRTPLPSKWVLSEALVNGTSDGSGAISTQARGASALNVRSADISLKVTLEQNDRVTPTDHWQDVRFLKLKTGQGVQYCPGDALAIRPQNMADDVQDLVQLMQWEGIADKEVKIRLNKSGNRPEHFPDPALATAEHVSLRQLLTSHLDIKAIPRRSFFSAIAQHTTNEMHRERLQEFTEPQYLDEYYDYAIRPRRSILEILQEFDSVKIPWQEALSVFPILRPRQFSIASGGALTHGGTVFELLVAIVKYRTVIKRIREGVCTRYLAQLPVGSEFEVVLKTEGRFHHPEQISSRRHLLVGAGTGIAPLRAVVHEKVRSGIMSTLVFGCRNAEADYFFKNEWQDMGTDGIDGDLQVLTAFSRDQRHKVYVQDQIRNSKSVILGHLTNSQSTIIICGSSGAMPKAIRQAFIDVLCSYAEEAKSQTMSVDEAEHFLVQMEKEGRYKQETW